MQISFTVTSCCRGLRDKIRRLRDRVGRGFGRAQSYAPYLDTLDQQSNDQPTNQPLHYTASHPLLRGSRHLLIHYHSACIAQLLRT